MGSEVVVMLTAAWAGEQRLRDAEYNRREAEAYAAALASAGTISLRPAA